MDMTRQCCSELARAGLVVIEQKKAPLDVQAWDATGRKGIIRLRLLPTGTT